MKQLINKIGIKKYHLLDGDGDAAAVVRREGAALASAPIDIAFLGIGENGHLAFNDPPIDDTSSWSPLLVKLRDWAAVPLTLLAT